MAFIIQKSDPQIDEIAKQLSVPVDITVILKEQQGEPLQVEKNGAEATIVYGRRVELFRGLGLLAEHCREENYQTVQHARFKMDGVMVSCSHNGVMNIDAAKTYIRYMALMGVDMMMLYTRDTYEVPEYPYFGYLRGRYSTLELRELDDYAWSYGIELIPCIQTLAHLEDAFRWPCFQEIIDCDNILLCGEEKTYDFIEAMIRACRNSFRTKRIHLGMDEAHKLGLGKYLDKNGFRHRQEIFCEHLDRVNEICKKYDFRPMIWSDMFFRLACQGAYYPKQDVQFDRKIVDMVPKNLDLVYWDYYHEEQELYDRYIRLHKQFDNPIVFAGGAWRWLGHGPAIAKSLYQSAEALRACVAQGVEEVFLTAWGDNGNEASYMCILPVMQQYAEFCYQGEVDEETLARRLLACTGESLGDMLLLDLANNVDDAHWTCSAGNPSKYLLYMDILGGIAERHTTASYPEKYKKNAVVLHEAARRSPNLGYMYETLANLCSVLAVKSRVGVDAQVAYFAGDREKLQGIADVVLPDLIEKMEKFHRSVYTQWIAECKINGYEVLDLRIGGLESRTRTAIDRIHAYLDGKIPALGELEEKRLTMDCRPNDEIGGSETMCNNYFAPAFSSCVV